MEILTVNIEPIKKGLSKIPPLAKRISKFIFSLRSGTIWYYDSPHWIIRTRESYYTELTLIGFKVEFVTKKLDYRDILNTKQNG